MEGVTVTTFIGPALVVIGSWVLYVVSQIRTDTKEMRNDIKALRETQIEHRVKIDNHNEWLKNMDADLRKMKAAAILIGIMFLFTSCHHRYFTACGSDRFYYLHKKQYKEFSKYYDLPDKRKSRQKTSIID